jgi:dTDP-4-amino-4,6-dideoxygalactose transaminase
MFLLVKLGRGLRGNISIQYPPLLLNNNFVNICQLLKPISISLSPNTEKDDVYLALKLIKNKKEWKISVNQLTDQRQSASMILEEEFKKYLGVKYAISFNSGRSAFLAILSSLNLNKDDEVLLQAFTCNAVPNPIIWAGFKPVYVDCDANTFNIDIEDLKTKITPRSKAIVVQHTFGLPADLDGVSKVCQENNLILIEDCAHSLGAEYKEKKAGTFGKVSFFSFSRDKVISSVYGGMVATNDDDLAKKIKEFQQKINYPSDFWVFQQLMHPILMNYLILPIYPIFGKYLLILFQWLHIFSKAVHWKEKRGKKPGYFPKKLPNALAILTLNQFKKLEKFNQHREEIARFYYVNLKDSKFELPPEFTDRKQIFLRFTIKNKKAHEIIRKAWEKNILIGDWYDKVIAPHDTRLNKIKYENGSCLVAEELATETFNLPTHINISQKNAQKIVKFLKKYGDQRS